MAANARLERTERLISQGKMLDAIRTLTELNRERRDPDLAARLIELRRDALPLVRRTSRQSRWPPRVRDRFAGTDGIPETTPDRLTAKLLRSAVFNRGYLIVRDLVERTRVDRLVDDIDRAFDAYDAHAAGADVASLGGWFRKFEPNGEAFVPRPWLRTGGAVLAVDCPPAFFDLMETFDEIGLRTLVTKFLGEQPFLLGQKCTLRRASATESFSDWHQDGSFMGEQIRSINVWIALSQCGIDAPSLDLVPHRLDRIVDTGTGDAENHWGVGSEIVDAAAEIKIVRPVFARGDAILFDQFALHRTGIDETMPGTRHAIETWFAAPSHYPPDQLPIAY